MNCPLGFDLVSLMRKGRGIQPPRRQERQGGEGEGGDVTVGHDLTGIVGRVMGFGDEKPGAAVAVLTPLGSEVGALHEGQVPTRAGIDFDRDPDFDFDFGTMIWLIDNPPTRTRPVPVPVPDPYPYPYTYTYPPHQRVRERVPLRCVRVRFWAELEGAFSDGLQLVQSTPAVQTPSTCQ
jgi:hypothetical protein